MDLASRTVLVTGGASGIGLALSERFLRAGSEVVICGRREEKLSEARQNLPGIHTRRCDVAQDSERTALCDWTTREFPRLDLLVNNAGIQRRVDLTRRQPWENVGREIAINLEAAMHLSILFSPHLAKQRHAAILNVTSGLAFTPLASVPIYSATKAAMHSFTLSLRQQLAGTSIQVIEIAPPAVDTDLGGPGLHKFGVPVEEFIDAVVPRLQAGDLEIAYGFADRASHASRAELDETFRQMNQPRP